MNIVERRVTSFQFSGKRAEGMAKCEYKVKNQAEPIETMAHRVKTQIKQLVGQTEEPNGHTLELREECTSPDTLHVEVESLGVSQVVMQFENDCFAAPTAMVVIRVVVGKKADDQ